MPLLAFILPLQVALPSAPPAPPPPLMIAPSAPRPVIQTGYSRPARRVALDVAVRSNGTTIWQGSLTVAERGASSWTQSRSEPDDEACGRGVYRYGGEREGLNVQLGLLSADDSVGASDRITVSVRWTHPAETECAGLRIVELRQTAVIPDQGRVVLKGDGGLTVELRRR